MPDQAIEQTDKELKKLEKEIYKLYSQSADEISAKWYKYMKSHEKTLRRTYEDLQIAKRSGDRDAIKEAQEKYERVVKNVTLNNDKYKAMLNETTAKLAHVNEVALSYINNKTPKIYTLNYNEFANQDIDGYTFTLVNENAVRNLIKSDKIELPPKKLDVPKDKRWNAKNINSQLMQGLLQGESIPKIAKRLQNVTDMNERSAVRSARTMVTGAQNKGRQDSFTKATNDGVIMERKWVAAYEPGRTRDWHLELNGVVVGVDEPFENSVGKIMYPGDPDADPSNVYNCRCAIRAIVKGFKWNQKEEYVEEAKEQTSKSKSTQSATTSKVVNGKDISDTWVRRPDEFDFEIEDVINAQGFDGLPRVVDAEEFDRYVQESNFVAQRTYSAPDAETLNKYRDELYNGKWYVDCSTGGAAYGQGMYCAGNYEGKLTDAIKQEMKDYQGQNLNYSGKESVHIIETLTLDKSAKIVDYENIYGEYSGIMRLAEREQIMNDYVNKSLSSLNKDEQIFAKFNLGQSGISWKEVSNAAENIDPQRQTEIMMYINGEKTKAEEYIQKLSREKLEKGNRIREKYTDVGSYAASKGYDAIRTTNGTSGADTVILNRTKVIFKKEK